MTPYVLSLIALTVLLSTASKLLHRYVLKESGPYAYALLNNVIGALFFLPLALRNFSVPTERGAWLILALASALWALLAVGKFVAYKGTEVSLKDPLDQSKLLWALLLGATVLGETPSVLRIIGTVVVFIGVSTLLFHPEKKLERLADAGIRWTLGAALLGAVVAVIDKYALRYFIPETYGLLVYIGPTLILLSFLPGRTAHIAHLLQHRFWTAIGGLLFSTAGYYLALKVYAIADITFVYPLLQLGTLLTAVGGIVIFREREHLAQKLITTAIIVTGSILVRF